MRSARPVVVASTKTAIVSAVSDRVKLSDIRIEKIGNEWCAFLNDSEIARGKDKVLLMDYLKDSVVTSR